MWVIETLQELGVDAGRHLVVCEAKLFVEESDGIDNILCERKDMNETSHDRDLLPVLLAELARVDMRSFGGTLQTQRALLKREYSDATIEEISQEYGTFFLRAYRGEEQLKAAELRCKQEKKGFLES